MKFVIYDTRPYVIEAETEDEAFKKFINMTLEECLKFEVDGGYIEVQPM